MEFKNVLIIENSSDGGSTYGYVSSTNAIKDVSLRNAVEHAIENKTDKLVNFNNGLETLKVFSHSGEVVTEYLGFYFSEYRTTMPMIVNHIIYHTF